MCVCVCVCVCVAYNSLRFITDSSKMFSDIINSRLKLSRSVLRSCIPWKAKSSMRAILFAVKSLKREYTNVNKLLDILIDLGTNILTMNKQVKTLRQTDRRTDRWTDIQTDK